MRRKHDAYDTPASAVSQLVKVLEGNVRFIEPCAGRGDLAFHLIKVGHLCVHANDIEPRSDLIDTADALTCDYGRLHADMFITNPPWDRRILHPLIERLSGLLPTWLLFDSDWANNVEAGDLLDHCELIVAQGRVKWIQDSPYSGKTNCAWYLFDAQHEGGPKWVNLRARRFSARRSTSAAPSHPHGAAWSSAAPLNAHSAPRKTVLEIVRGQRVSSRLTSLSNLSDGS